MKLYELLNQTEYFDGELVTEDICFDCTLVWDKDQCKITDYAMRKDKYFYVLNSDVVYCDDELIMISCQDYMDVNHFLYASAGYVNEEEYNKLFVGE